MSSILVRLKIEHFAIIDNVDIEFKDGFTTFTGETGAGKSLILDAISMLLGNRSLNSNSKEDKIPTIIEGIFENLNEKTLHILNDFNIDLNEDCKLIIHREIAYLNKDLIKVNDVLISLNKLKRIGQILGDIHYQNDKYKLFDSTMYFNYLDDNRVLQAIVDYNEVRKDYLKYLTEYNKINRFLETDSSQLDLWKHQYNELVNANLNIDEENNIIKELDVLNNFETIFNSMSCINNTFNDHNIIEYLHNILIHLNTLRNYKPEYHEYYNLLNDFYYELEEIKNVIKKNIDDLDFNEYRINVLNSRLNTIKALKNKYKKTIKELIQFRGELRAKIENFELKNDKILACKNNVEKSHIELCAKSHILTSLRKDNAKKLIDSLKVTLSELQLQQVNIDIVFNDYDVNNPYLSTPFYKEGCDKIDFLVSFNLGEELKPLSKVASGGELSRFMLALKLIGVKIQGFSTIIFDEIDTGVSGRVAEKIAEKLKELSKNTQVIAITHLPIVASYSDYQYHIYKNHNNFKTTTHIKQLDHNDRISLLANMINPNDVTDQTKKLASIMIMKNK